ncbi:hypothetical protein [Streptomyces uncialis]|uniref:hypothetical protein n=1 Tax=Streptomyces uncialis TaxID=1048205 RepID=UPI00386FE967|nr:hypothetical protein OG924_00030 [Streptomyces uncialis]WTE15353.1 hypothetical protein OG924_36970 [Streptomyces uncialis]
MELAEDVVDVLVVLGEDVGGEPDDGAGDALGCVRARLSQVRRALRKTCPRASRAKVSAHAASMSGPGRAVTGATIRVATSTRIADVRGSAAARAAATSSAPACTARRWSKAAVTA